MCPKIRQHGTRKPVHTTTVAPSSGQKLGALAVGANVGSRRDATQG